VRLSTRQRDCFNYSRDYCSFDRLLDLFYNIYVVLSAAAFLIRIYASDRFVFTKQLQLNSPFFATLKRLSLSLSFILAFRAGLIIYAARRNYMLCMNARKRAIDL
jgi:hypothetical protein